MKFKKIMLMLLVILVFLTISAVASADNSSCELGIVKDNGLSSEISLDQRTFSATGDSVGYSQDSFYNAKLSSYAKKQLNQFKSQNKNNPTKYVISISESQYNQLVSAKNQGKIKEIQIKTDKSIVVKKPVMKTYTKSIFSQKYYKQTSFNKALKKFKDKYFWDDDIQIKVSTKWKKSKDKSYGNINIVDYKKITIYKKYRIVKSFKDSKDKITASIIVNDMQADGKDWVRFFAPSMAIDGVVAEKHISL